METENIHSQIKRARFIGALIFAASLYFALFAFNDNHEVAFGLGLIVFPILIGLFTPFIADPQQQLRPRNLYGLVALVYFLLTVFLMFAGRETAFCLIIGAPIFWILTAVGLMIARRYLTRMLEPHTLKSYALIAAIPIILAPIEMPHKFNATQHHVTNQVIIAASPQAVWDQIISFDPIQDDERIWAFSHNILGGPLPVRSEMQGDTRHAHWTMSVAYEEQITTQTADRMAWDIVFADDFAMDGYDKHIHPNSTQFRLLSGAYDVTYDGTHTTLTLRTDYQLRTIFNAYIALWGQQFLGDNHRAILHVIKQRAETL